MEMHQMRPALGCRSARDGCQCTPRSNALRLAARRAHYLQMRPEWQKFLFERGTVEYDNTDTYAFGYRAVQDKAPNMSGVYTIYTSRRWLYVGESDDVKQSLFKHLSEPSACMTRRG